MNTAITVTKIKGRIAYIVGALIAYTVEEALALLTDDGEITCELTLFAINAPLWETSHYTLRAPNGHGLLVKFPWE